jgi:hypothetical protein
MLMKVKDETIPKHPNCHFDDNDKPGKHESQWERTLWESYSYRNPTPDCDTKRSGPCKYPENS